MPARSSRSPSSISMASGGSTVIRWELPKTLVSRET